MAEAKHEVEAAKREVQAAKAKVQAAEAKVEAAKAKVQAAKAKVQAAKAKVEAAEREVQAAKHEFRAATDAEEKEMLIKYWKTAQKGLDGAHEGLGGAHEGLDGAYEGLDGAHEGLDDALAFAKSQRDRLVQLQKSTDAGTLPQHCKHPPTCCRGGNRVYGPLASLAHCLLLASWCPPRLAAAGRDRPALWWCTCGFCVVCVCAAAHQQTAVCVLACVV